MEKLVITSASNAQVKELIALNTKRKERKSKGLFTAEGIKLFQEAKKELIQNVYITKSFEKEHEELLKDTDYTVMADELFERICDTKTPQGILTVLKQPEYELEDLLAEPGKAFILVLEDVQDPGNVGTILRTSEGAGVTGIIMSRGCADVFSPKVIRSTMGSIFRVPFVYVDDVKEAVSKLKEKNIKTYAAHLKGSVFYDEPAYEGGTAVFIGNEGNGLTDELSNMADVLVKIPMEGKLESLNAAIASSIIMYTIYRKRV